MTKMTNNSTDLENCKNMIWKLTLNRFNKMKYKRPDIEFEDLLSEGYWVYAWCLKNYDDHKKTKFTTYLYTQLNGRLRDYYTSKITTMNLYEDYVDEDCDKKTSFEDQLVSKRYDLSEDLVYLNIDASENLSYEAQDILKFILSRKWETASNHKAPSNERISKMTGYPKDIVNSAMGEIKHFWTNRKSA